MEGHYATPEEINKAREMILHTSMRNCEITKALGIPRWIAGSLRYRAGLSGITDDFRLLAVYALQSPLDGKFYYVGITQDTKKRLAAHLRCRGTSDMLGLKSWILHLKSIGQPPELVILEDVYTRHWREHEKRWIQKLLDEGHPLMNNIH